MPRTESKNFQCHPDNVQNQIDLHQKFHWSLLSSQDVKNTTSGLERYGDKLYSTTTSEHFVKLTFSRDLNTPNLSEIKKLEAACFALDEPRRPERYSLPVTIPYSLGMLGVFCLFITVASFVFGAFGTMGTFGIAAAVFLGTGKLIQKMLDGKEEAENRRRTREYEQELAEFKKKRQAILAEVEKYQ